MSITARKHEIFETLIYDIQGWNSFFTKRALVVIATVL